jgi:L-ascorbate metabolism protein UlaG (beta-lactamase superfamily)
MIIPLQKNDALLADIDAAAPGRVHLWWLGQSGFLVRSDDTCVLLDPYLSDTLTVKYAETDKPHVRMTEQVIDPARLTFVCAATSTHAHTDHLDHGTLLPLRQANPDLQLIIPRAIRELAEGRLGDWGDAFRWTNAGETQEVNGVRFTAVPAAHNELDRDDDGNHHYVGYIVEIGGKTIYHSGDTLMYDGMVDILRAWDIDVAILPINGNKPERRVSGNLDGAEAAQLAKDIGAGTVIPCHYEMFAFNTASPDLFRSSCERLSQPHSVMQAGERSTV